MMDRMASWAIRHDAAGPIHLGQRLGHLKQEPRYFRAVVYDKGAWVLHMLRGLVGDEAFFAGARAFLERHRYAKAGTEDLRAALEAASGRDLRPYFERWIYETGLPVLVWRWTATSAARLAASARRSTCGRSDFPGPLPLQMSVVTDRRHRVAHRAARARGRLVHDRHARGAAAGGAQRGPRAARADRARRPRAGSAIAVAAALVLERRDARLDLGELLLVLVQERDVGRAAGAVEAAACR